MLKLITDYFKRKNSLMCPNCSGTKIDSGKPIAEEREDKLCKISYSIKCEECGATGTVVEIWN